MRGLLAWMAEEEPFHSRAAFRVRAGLLWAAGDCRSFYLPYWKETLVERPPVPALQPPGQWDSRPSRGAEPGAHPGTHSSLASSPLATAAAFPASCFPSER